MKKYLIAFGLSLLIAMPSFSQVSNDNEDEVNKIDTRFRHDFVPGQVIVKMKDSSPAKVRRVQGKFKSAGINRLDAVLQEFGVEDMEQLLPKEKTGRKMRKAKAFNGTTIEEKDLSQLYLVKVSEEKQMQTQGLIDALQELTEVEFAEPNYKAYIMGEPTDETICTDPSANPLYAQQWGLPVMAVDQLWTKPIVNGQRPVIAIIDTGVDMTHPDLVDNLWTNAAEADGEEGYDNDGNGFKNDVHGWDFINNTGAVRDFNMHGTHVAGIAAAADNGIGIIGANPRALIMSITVMQSDGTGDLATVIKGINYAVQNGATVLNLSLGTYANSSALRQALANAYQSAVIVAAAGNDGKCINTPHYLNLCKEVSPMFPAAYSFVLGVQATGQNGALAPFSNYDDDGNSFSSVTTFQDPDGFNYELKAPGTNILSTIPGGKYRVLQGTSMAAPLVAGAVSALKMVKEYDTQEILWGDLLHTNNMAEAYELTARPAELDLLRIQMHDRKELADEMEDDYSGDNEIDAGETVSIYPVIRTTFGEASNIKMHLEMGDEFEDPTIVDIQTGQVDFGLHLDAYGKGVSQNPLVMKIADGVADNRHIKMKVVATCNESSETFEWPFTVVVTNMVKISGMISEDRTLTADKVYLVNDNLAILEGATLTIEPGTRLEFAENKELASFGKLVAQGTPEKPIVFTGHNGATWNGIRTHEPTGRHYHGGVLYTNETKTLFTLLPTETTPNKFSEDEANIVFYYGDDEAYPEISSTGLGNYIKHFSEDMTFKQEMLTDPNYLTPAVLQMLNDLETLRSQYSTEYSNDKHVWTVSTYFLGWYTSDNPRDMLSFCRLDNIRDKFGGTPPYVEDCVFSYSTIGGSVEGIRCNLSLSETFGGLEKSNIINNVGSCLTPWSDIVNNNFFNNNVNVIYDKKYNSYVIGIESATPTIDKSDNPSYLGTSREDIVRPYIYEFGNAPDTYGQVDLSNMLTEPVREAHGIVWKVVVNGYDAQDEFEDLPPLGVGKHKFEVYFNRPMNKAVAPQVSFGVREPYTQNAVAEDGSWNEEGTIYTAYKTITGKTKSDGLNRIYVYGAEDDEYFEIPYEKSRFNINIQAAGSMATGFAAEAGLGKVNLTWHNENNDFEDAMGFNVYRYTLDDNGEPTNVVRLNEEIIDIDATSYTDYEVTPGETYHYYYKVLSTDLQEFDISNVVAATPQTGELGDANGSGEVDVADVITTVNYAAGQQPKPFIFEAADMNADLSINILDVIGIIKKILYPDASAKPMIASTATYTIEDGTLYVESPVELAGVQVRLAFDTEEGLKMRNEGVRVADDLNGFEHTSAWLSDNDFLFLAYNMAGKTLSAGKHALLHIGSGKIGSIRLSDANGGNVEATGNETTRVNRLATDVMTVRGIYDLQGRKISGDSENLKKLPKGVYIVNGKKVIK